MAKLHGLARIGRDAEVRFTQSGDPVASLSLAFTYGQKGKDGNRPTQWVDGSLWGKRAETLAPYLTKGKQVVVYMDDVHIAEYKTKDGRTGSKMVGRISDLELVWDSAESKPVQQTAAPTASSQASLGDLDENIPF